MVGMLFPHLSEKLPGRKLKKGRWNFDRAVFVVFLFQSWWGGAAGPVQESPEETAEGSRESCEEGRETGQTGEATQTLPTSLPTAAYGGASIVLQFLLLQICLFMRKCFLNIFNSQISHLAHIVVIFSEWNWGCEV